MDEQMLRMAVDAITEGLKTEPENAQLYKERGRLRMMLHDERGAMEDLREAIRLDPTIVSDLQDGQFEGKIGSCH